jgi:hypothetical protein
MKLQCQPRQNFFKADRSVPNPWFRNSKVMLSAGSQ